MNRRNESALLYSKTKAFAYKVKNAETIIARMFTVSSKPYVGFSSGKDSTVVAFLVSQFITDVPLLYGDEEWLLPETDEYLQRVQALNRSRFHRIKAADTHAEWFKVWQDDPNAIHSDNASGVYAKSQGWNGCFLGLRQDENARRKIYLRSKGPLFYSEKDGVWMCNPIHDWMWMDVWALIVSRSIDYNRAYDKLEEMGVEPERQRIGPLAQERVLGYGQLVILKRGWPDLFNRFAEKFPEATRYT